MAEFMNRVNEGLDEEVPDGDQQALLTCMTHIRDVRKNMTRTHRAIQPLRDTVALVKSHGVLFKHDFVALREREGDLAEIAVLDFLDSAGFLWDDTINKMFKRKETIQGQQDRMADHIASDIDTFRGRVEVFAEELYRHAPFQHAGTLEQAYAGGV